VIAPSREDLFDWAVERLNEGMSMARWAATSGAMDGFDFALVTSHPTAVNDLRFGIGSAAPWEELAIRLVQASPTGRLFVEMPLSHPDDPAPSGSFQTCHVSGNVYAHAAASEGQVQAERVLRAHDPSFLYAALVVAGPIASPDCSTAQSGLMNGDLSLEVAVVGALDGEGFVCGTRQRSTS
jgi:hypothetical protein